MKGITFTALWGAAWLLALPRVAQADYVITPFGIILEGTVTVNPGGTVTIKPQKFEPCYFRIQQVRILRVPTVWQQFRKELSAAKEVEQTLAAARWALKHGLIDEFYSTLEQVMAQEPNHAIGKQVFERRASLQEEAREDAEALDALVQRLDHEMKVKRSLHFVLLYDTEDERADERLRLLESVYERFLLYFWSFGIDLPKPSERLRVVLFDQEDDFKAFSTSVSPTLTSVAGFWEPTTNVSVFYAHGRDGKYDALLQEFETLKDEAAAANRRGFRGAAILARLANTLRILLEVFRENIDIEVVSHEATHQMAGNTGLFPREVRTPQWVHEGLATFFESPKDGAWSGIGTVNDQRLAWYHLLAGHDRFSTISFVVGDEVFDLAATGAAIHSAYGQSWALTHYLMNEDPEKLFDYYRMLAQLPPDMVFSPQVLRKCFEQVFGDQRVLTGRWRAYMSKLKPDLIRALESQ